MVVNLLYSNNEQVVFYNVRLWMNMLSDVCVKKGSWMAVERMNPLPKCFFQNSILSEFFLFWTVIKIINSKIWPKEQTFDICIKCLKKSLLSFSIICNKWLRTRTFIYHQKWFQFRFFLSLPTPLNSQPCSWFYFNFKESVKKAIKKYFGHSIHKNEQKT